MTTFLVLSCHATSSFHAGHVSTMGEHGILGCYSPCSWFPEHTSLERVHSWLLRSSCLLGLWLLGLNTNWEDHCEYQAVEMFLQGLCGTLGYLGNVPGYTFLEEPGAAWNLCGYPGEIGPGNRRRTWKLLVSGWTGSQKMWQRHLG